MEFFKKYRKWIMRIAATLVILAAFLGACSTMNRYLGVPDDNPIEEIIEKQIENETGFNVDLTPESPER